MTNVAIASAVGATIVLLAWRVRPTPGRPKDDHAPSRSSRRRPSLHLGRRHRRRAGPDAVAAWSDGIAAEIRAGSSVRSALIAIHPKDPAIAARIAPVRRALERGSNLRQACAGAIDHQRGRVSDPGIDAALTVIVEVADHGGSASEPIERVAAAARLRAADEQDRSTHSAQARLSAHVLTLVPIAVLAMLGLGDRRVGETITSTGGAALVTAGVIINAVGWLWMQAIIRRLGRR